MFGTTGGVLKVEGSSWITYTTADGLVDNHVYAVAIDNQGNKWFGTDGGVSKFDGSKWTHIKRKWITRNFISSIAIDKKGNKWIGVKRRRCHKI